MIVCDKVGLEVFLPVADAVHLIVRLAGDIQVGFSLKFAFFLPPKKRDKKERMGAK